MTKRKISLRPMPAATKETAQASRCDRNRIRIPATLAAILLALTDVYGGGAEKVTCTITSGTTSRNLATNMEGLFPRVSGISPSSTLSIQCSYPDGNAGDKVCVALEDGGALADGNGAQVVAMDAARRISFHFTAGKSQGIYRIDLRRGTELRVIQLWIGDELPLAKK